MRNAQLTAIRDGINRLRPKGGARADSLYDLVNAYVTAERTVVGRPGTRRGTVDVSGTVGLVAFENALHVFSSSYIDIATLITTVTVGASGTIHGWWGDFAIGSADPDPPNDNGALLDGIYVDTNPTPDRLYFTGVDSGDVLAALQAYPTIRVEYSGGTIDFDTADLTTPDPASAAFSATDYPEITTLWAAADVGESYRVWFVAPGAGEIADGYVLDILLHPLDSEAELTRIHYAAPFLGHLYVVAEFDDGQIYHYWLQAGTAWEADTEIAANEFRTPTTPNGYVYRAVRLGQPYPAWTPGAPRTEGNGSSIEPSIIEPTTYNEYYYTAIETQGDNPASGTTEPPWPTETGATIVESTDGFSFPNADAANPPTPPEANTPQSSTTDRYTL